MSSWKSLTWGGTVDWIHWEYFNEDELKGALFEEEVDKELL